MLTKLKCYSYTIQTMHCHFEWDLIPKRKNISYHTLWHLHALGPIIDHQGGLMGYNSTLWWNK